MKLTLNTLLLMSLLLAPAAEAATATVKIFIEPQEGFDSYISAAIVKKKVPAIVTQNRADADFVLTSVVTTHQESTGSKIARCLFVYCAGIDGNQTATVQLVNPKKEVAWAYNVKKGGAKNFQSSSEAIAKHLKNFLEKRK
jgi:hypothetical protein